jgi:hypothetical protein
MRGSPRYLAANADLGGILLEKREEHNKSFGRRFHRVAGGKPVGEGGKGWESRRSPQFGTLFPRVLDNLIAGTG